MTPGEAFRDGEIFKDVHPYILVEVNQSKHIFLQCTSHVAVHGLVDFLHTIGPTDKSGSDDFVNGNTIVTNKYFSIRNRVASCASIHRIGKVLPASFAALLAVQAVTAVLAAARANLNTNL